MITQTAEKQGGVEVVVEKRRDCSYASELKEKAGGPHKECLQGHSEAKGPGDGHPESSV